MKEFDYKKDCLEITQDVRNKLLALPEAAHIRKALSFEQMDEITEQIETISIDELEWQKWPPLLLFINRHTLSDIFAFESDINIVINNSHKKAYSQIIQHLKASPDKDRDWAGVLFEIFVKSSCLKEKGLAVQLDYPLPNGKETDVRVEIGGKAFYLECTVITDSDEDREVWDKFIDAKKVDPETFLIRPGQFDPLNAKGPSQYYDCLRFYAKVYDKIAKDLDPEKSQLSEDALNILLISFFSPYAHLSPMSRGIGWALDELFSDQPRTPGTIKNSPPNIIDISVLAYLSFTEKRLIKEGLNLNPNKDTGYFNKLINAARKISGIMLFDRCCFKAGRVNYNAKKECRISHHEMAKMEELFTAPPDW